MKIDDAAARLEALGNRTRLQIYRALVRAGHAGMPVGRLQDAGEGARALGKVAGDLPALLSRAARLSERVDELTRDGFVLAPQSLRGIGEAEARRNRWSTVALWLIALLLAVHLFLD